MLLKSTGAHQGECIADTTPKVDITYLVATGDYLRVLLLLINSAVVNESNIKSSSRITGRKRKSKSL